MDNCRAVLTRHVAVWFTPIIAGPLGGWEHNVFSPAAVFGLTIISLLPGALVLVVTSLRGKLV